VSRPPPLAGSVDPAPRALAADDADIEELGVSDIVEQMEEDGGITDDLGQPILPLTTSKVPSSKTPRAPAAAPIASIDDVLAALGRASTRDEVIDNLIAGMSTVAMRVGAFAVRKRGFCGIACNSDWGPRAAFRSISIATDAPTVLGIAARKGSYLGPLPATAPHEPLLRFMKGTSGDVAVIAVSVAGRPAVIVFADALADKTIASRRADELARLASFALSRIVTEAKMGRRRGA
jgi:hypothetical protein